MNTIKVIVILLAVIMIAGATFIWFSSRPLSKPEAMAHIEKRMDNSLSPKKSVTSALVYIDAPEKDFTLAYGTGTSDDIPVTKEMPFHMASVGKMFVSTLIGQLIEEEKLTLEDPISNYLDEEILNDLFIYEDVDYKDQVTVGQLLMHTSGLADYFMDDEEGGLFDQVIKSPDHLYTPKELIDYTRTYQSMKFAPGTGYNYSDTGFIILGLIIESVYGKTYDDMLHEVIFTPLKMDDTYLMFYSKPTNGLKPITEIWLDGNNVTDYNSVSIDWAGGGVISTLEDMSIFLRALYNGQIIKEETVEMLNQFDETFMNGINYGYGFMEMEFTKFFPTLGFLPKMRGHMGVLGTLAFYDKESDMVYISSYGSTDFTTGSVQEMIQALSAVYRIK